MFFSGLLILRHLDEFNIQIDQVSVNQGVTWHTDFTVRPAAIILSLKQILRYQNNNQ